MVLLTVDCKGILGTSSLGAGTRSPSRGYREDSRGPWRDLREDSTALVTGSRRKGGDSVSVTETVS
jgi:hypothetical protein